MLCVTVTEFGSLKVTEQCNRMQDTKVFTDFNHQHQSEQRESCIQNIVCLIKHLNDITICSKFMCLHALLPVSSHALHVADKIERMYKTCTKFENYFRL